MTGRHMIVATQATREAGVRFGRVIARRTVSRWMTNTPSATIAPTRSADTPVIGISGGNPGLQAGEEAGASRSGAMIVP